MLLILNTQIDLTSADLQMEALEASGEGTGGTQASQTVETGPCTFSPDCCV